MLRYAAQRHYSRGKPEDNLPPFPFTLFVVDEEDDEEDLPAGIGGHEVNYNPGARLVPDCAEVIEDIQVPRP